jgi:glycerophosphoryl diester phosphodiesterase
MSANNPDLVVLGHRGDPRHENTLRGLRECLATGLDGAEVDVRLIADGTVVLFHDDSLERVVGDLRRVGELRREDLATIDVFGEPLPTLEELLAEWPEDRWLNIELKAGDRPLVEAVLPRIAGREKIVLSSFDPGMLEAASELGCDHELAVLLSARSPMWLHADAGRSFGCRSVHLHASLVSGPTIERYRSLGLRVGFWGAFDRAHEQTLAGLGVARVITDFVVDSRL